jgi:ATP-grasp domain, R2K clade family 3
VNIALVENKLFVVSQEVGVSAYDFNFELHFSCSHPYQIDGQELCVLRVGPIADYLAEFNAKLDIGLRLINSPQEHSRASELEAWYPVIQDLTPRSRVFDALPAAQVVEAEFSWPVFLKGSRQTSKHNPDLSVIRDRTQYERVAQLYGDDPILHWQKPVVREFVALAPIPGAVPGKVRPSVEYRSFWWYGECVGWGRYWYQVEPYQCADANDGLAVAGEAAARLKVPFLVVDYAKTEDGRWIVIECNDAQEAGYVGVPPRTLWDQVLSRIAGIGHRRANDLSRDSLSQEPPPSA